MHFGEHRSRNGTLTEDSQTTNMSSQSSSQCCYTDWKKNIISSKSIVYNIQSLSLRTYFLNIHVEGGTLCFLPWRFESSSLFFSLNEWAKNESEPFANFIFFFSNIWTKIRIQTFNFFLWTAYSKIVCWYKKQHYFSNN